MEHIILSPRGVFYWQLLNTYSELIETTIINSYNILSCAYDVYYLHTITTTPRRRISPIFVL